MRIMHGPSEVAGQNMYSVKGLKEVGEDAESIVYYKHSFSYSYDKCLNIDKSKKLLIPLYGIKLSLFLVEALRKYDVFHFHFGHSILDCTDLPIYKLFGKKVFFEFHGSDLRDLEQFCKKSGMQFDPAEATPSRIHRRNKRICKEANGIIVHDDELLAYLPNIRCETFVVPLRMDLTQFETYYPEIRKEQVTIVHAPSNREGKGTSFVLNAVHGLKEKGYDIELLLVEGMSQKEAFEIYKKADIIVDQLYAGTYGVFSIESMAMGKPVITYISDEMRERLPKELPIISANANNLEEKLEALITDGTLRNEIGKESRLYVENYHDYRVIALILRDIYYGKAKPLSGRASFELVKTRKNEIL